MKPKQILHLVSKYNGDYPLFDDFVLRLDPQHFQSTVCFLRGWSENKSRLEKEGIITLFPAKDASRSRGINPKTLWMLKRIVQERGIDLIHCHRHKPTVYGVLVSLLVGGRPVVSTVHGTKRTRSTKRRLVNRIILRKVNRITAVSKAVRKDILRTNNWLNREKVVAVRNGLNYEKILRASSIDRNIVRQELLPDHARDFWFGNVGRLTPVKNQKRLINAFAGVAKKNPDCILIIAGSGPMQEELEGLVQSLQLTGRAYLLGYMEDVPKLLRSLDAFVFPSLREGLGLALLEAMASALPIVASRIEASEEVMNEIECGVYVDPEDENDLLDGMIIMKELPQDQRSLMGERARKRVVEAFAVDRLTQEMTQVYNELL